jgi:hypothetical protein
MSSAAARYGPILVGAVDVSGTYISIAWLIDPQTTPRRAQLPNAAPLHPALPAGRFYRPYDMLHPCPWAVISLLEIPANLTVDLLAHRIPALAWLQDRYAMWRRNTWFRNEMGEKQAEFKPAEEFRR